MTSARLRRILAAIVLMAAAPASNAGTRISCDFDGTVANLPEQMRQYRVDGTEISQLMFRLKVKSANIPEGARADTDCTEFVGREIDVVLEAGGDSAAAIRKGKPLKMRYRYDDSLGQAQAAKFELVR